MNKIKKISLFLILAINLSAQSKKEIIVILNSRIDSLKTVLLKESEFNTNKISELNLQINNNTSKISVLTNDLNKANSENNNLKNKTVLLGKDIKAKIIENNNLAQKIKKTNDSLYPFIIRAKKNGIKPTKKSDLEKRGIKGKVKKILIDGGYDKNGLHIESTIQIFNESGNIIEYSNSNFKYTTLYNSTGNMIEEYSYNADRTLTSKTTYKYDEKGNMIKNNGYKADGSLTSKTTYKYDENGNLIEEICEDNSGELLYKFTKEYDEIGNNIKSGDYNGMDYIESILIYDENGNCIKETQFLSGYDLYCTITSKYNKAGDPIKKNYDYNSGTNEDYEYIYDEFDQHGNCVKKTTLLNKKKVIENYKFEYY